MSESRVKWREGSQQKQKNEAERQKKQQQQRSGRTKLRGMSLPASSLLALLLASLLLWARLELAEARVTFEKMTNRDYSGLNYYTIQNVSLFECLGWCKEEAVCTSAVFSFVVNPFAALQETTCMLQNETQARQVAHLRQLSNGDQVTVAAQPQKATNLYFFNKLELPTESVCGRLWAFERFPNKRLRNRDRQAFHASSKEACQAACMNEQRFVCRSLEYNYISQQCTLNGYDRRSPLILHMAAAAAAASQPTNSPDLIDSPGTDYFENACLLGEDICNESRIYDYAKIGLPLHRVAHFVELNYYPDKEMLVKSQAGCVRACTIEHEFICRSILYRSSYKQGQPNCALYHLDQRTFPEGAETFMSHVMQPLLDSGESSAVYLEAVCNDTIPALLPVSSASPLGATITMPPTSITIMPSSTTPGGISVHASSPGSANNALLSHLAHQNHSSHELERLMASTSTLSPLNGSPSTLATTIRLPTTFLPSTGNGLIPSNIHISDLPSVSSQSAGRPLMPAHLTIGPPRGPQMPSTLPSSSSLGSGGNSQIPAHLVISPAPPPFSDGRDPTSLQITGSGNGPTNHDQNCDAHGFCYDVSLKCTDTKMVVNVKTQRPFFGRIYALGRSETCNANIKNQNQFQLDMYLTGQECNTQSASGTYTNTIVLQHHNVVLTKADKVYHVRCTYETASRNVSFGMMPVKDMFEVGVDDSRNAETLSITASSDAPLPKISIMTNDGKEASTVRIGDRLTFRIEIPDNTPYGIFARSCIAMAKDARSTFEIIDEHGCPVDHTIFPNFVPVSNGNALESNYEAFRFTESYGVIFQCNVKYCIGKCEPVTCGIGLNDQVQAWGRKKRSIGGGSAGKAETGKQLADDMTLSREIVVLDLKEKDPQNAQSAAPNEAAQDSSQDSPPSYQNLNSPQASSQRSPLKSNSLANNHQDDSDFTVSLNSNTNKHCLSSQSLLVLICSIGVFFVLYVCVVAYFFARRDPKISPIKHQYH